MAVERQLTLDDYLRILRRRLWLILIPAVIGPVATYLISLAIPDRYTSKTLVLVEQPKVPDSFVKPVVADDLDQRLQTMREQILSRSRLQPIIDRFGLYKKDAGKASTEELIERMRKDIKVETVRPEASREVPGFRISFNSDNARTAQQVCAEILSMFMQENLRLREQHAQGTTDFLSSQLDDAKRKLDEQDSKLASFKQRYIGQLPGQEQANMQILTGLNSQLEATNQALSRAQQDKTFTESMLAQQLADWKSQQAPDNQTNPAAVEEQLTKLQDSLLAAQARYTSDHPDVIKLKREIAALKNKLNQKREVEHKDVSAASSREPAAVKQLRVSLYQLEQTIKEKTRQQQTLQAEIRTYQSRIQLSPVVEEQFKEITRDYQTALTFYNDLLSKKTQSEMATELERKQQGEQFRIIDPPDEPEKPTFPNRPMFAFVGLGIGMGLGLGVSFLLEMQSKAIRTDEDITRYLDLPTLAMVPLVGAEVKGETKAKSSAAAQA